MKFSEIEREQWEELQPYLDTCLLPLTGMDGSEQPYEATEWLEKLRDLMDMIEIPFKGRVVTYPACHYTSGDGHFAGMVVRLCESLKSSGFKYVIAVTTRRELAFDTEAIDMWLAPNADMSLPEQTEVSGAVRSMWSGQAT